MIQRILDVGTKEGIVHDHLDAPSMRNSGNGSDIHEAQRWIAWRLNPNQACFGANQLGNIQLQPRREGDLHAMSGCHLGKVPVCSTIHIRDRYDVGASRERLKDCGRGGATGGEGQRIFSMLESRDSLFEIVSVWVCASGVLVRSYWLADGSLCKGGGQGDLVSS